MASNYDRPLQISARKHDLVGVHVHDRRERELPDIGLARVFDSERRNYRWINTSDARLRAGWRAHHDDRCKNFLDTFRRAGSDIIDVESSIPEEKIRQREYITALHRFFRKREKRK